MGLNAKIQLSSLKTEGGVWGDTRTDGHAIPLYVRMCVAKNYHSEIS